MAKIVAEFDTVTKELKITKNGEAIPNINSVSMYNYYSDEGKGYIEMTTSTSDADEGIYTYTKIYANAEGNEVEEKEERSSASDRAKRLAKLLNRK